MGAVSMEQRALVGPLVPGSKLGRYEILAKLAAGGMAIVYVGRVQGVAGFERLVAMKVLHANLAHEDEFIRMFLDEARLAASIRHPNVVPTIDISDSEEAGYFIVMEYIEGDHLGALLSNAQRTQDKLPLPIVLRIVADALGGLGAAHDLCDDTGKSLHLVHRDVSPHNIMVGRDGVVRLTDFGVAKAEDRLTHTRDGQVKGKLAYMAPEQAASGQTDLRSDLFSMGVILWECVTGERLFRAENTGVTLHKLLHDAIPTPSSVDPALAPLDALLSKALAREPAARFQSAEQFAQAIEEVAPLLGGLSSLRGVARVVKHHTAVKLKREKKLIDDAMRALRPADAPDLGPELEAEITSPSASEISITGSSLSASKVSGVFSHDTIPGARRVTVRRRADDPPTGLRVFAPPTAASLAEPPPSGLEIDVVLPRFSGAPSSNEIASVLGTIRTAAATEPRTRMWLWVVAAAVTGMLAFWMFRPDPEHVRVGAMSNLEVPVVQPAHVLETPTVTSAHPGLVPNVAINAPKPAEPAHANSANGVNRVKVTDAANGTPVNRDSLTEREPRALAAQHDEPSSTKLVRRVHKDRVESSAHVAPREVSHDASDVIPNPYHN